MNKAKKAFYTITTCVAVGMVVGILFAPEKGSETRRKIRKLKHKMGLDSEADEEKYTLDELKEILQTELAIVNEKLEQLS